jgi:Domain of unknown function (DUF6259)
MNRVRSLHSLAAILLGVLTVSASGPFQSSAPDTVPSIENGWIRLRFAAAGGSLTELVDLRSGHNFVDPSTKDADLWHVDFVPDGKPASLSPGSARTFSHQNRGRGSRSLRLVWEQFADPGAQGMRVVATVKLDDKGPMSRWRIAVENLGGRTIEKLRFPRIVNIRHQPDERLAVPVWMGELTQDPRAAICDRPGQPPRLEWPYPGTLSLQCLAFYRDGGPGLYLSSDDTAAFRKAFAFWGDAGRSVAYEAIHLPDNIRPPRTGYSPAYDTLVGAFQGDWITAAERYRAWGIVQPWAVKSRKSLGLSPNWLADTGFWVWNRGRSDRVLEPARAMRKALGLPVSVFWHWWHGCSYDAGFPEYLPPREGVDAFRQAVGRARDEGINAIVYMNQRLWGMTTRSWMEKDAEKYAVKAIDGRVRPEVYNTYTLQPCASMCMGTSFWRGTYAEIAEEVIRTLGVSGIYMDQACSSLLCYDPSHGHPLGGGTFWINGFRTLSSDIRSRTTASGKVLLAGEGSGEAWLPYLDLMLTLQVSRERYARPGDRWQVIPFFQAVYHDVGVTYGNYGSLTIPPYDELWPAEYAPPEPFKLLDRRFAKQFYLEQARSFVWGVQPTVSNFFPTHLDERHDEMQYVMKLARLRYGALKYLLDGVFLRPPQLSVPSMTVPISRLSIYAGRRSRRDAPPGKSTGEDAVEDAGRGAAAARTSLTSAGVLAGAWRARDGSVGIPLASILDDPVRLDLDLVPYGAGKGSRLLFSDEAGQRELTLSASGSTARIRLGPRGAGILVLTP